MHYGYARVSTNAQDLSGQVEELEAAGCAKIHSEAASAAAGRKRPQLIKMLADLEAGDVVTVVRLNRLARSARDALNILSTILSKGAGFRSLHEPWADTTTPAGRLLVTVLLGFAEFDREMILERTAEGRRAAKARGVKMGRPPAVSGPQLRFILASRAADPPTPIGELVRITGISKTTIGRVLKAARSGEEIPTRGPHQIDVEEILKAAG